MLAVNIDADVTVAGLVDLVRDLFDLFADLAELAAHEAFDRIKRIFRVRHRLSFGDLADETISVLGKSDHRRCRASAFRICDNDRFAAFHNGDHRVCRTKIDSYDFAHFYKSPITNIAMLNLKPNDNLSLK